MGKKKKFIDKRKPCATFRLVYRDSSDFPLAEEGSDRVFSRIDGGTSFIPGLSEGDPALDSSFAAADAFGDEGDAAQAQAAVACSSKRGSGALPQHVRQELIELGFPDDGYNYLQHLREMGPPGSFVPSRTASLQLPPTDLKAYDATCLEINSSQKPEIFDLSVSSQVSQIRNHASAQRLADPEVSALLEATDGLQLDPADELEDDFVAKANGQIEEENAGVVGFLHDAEDGEQIVENNETKERPKRLLDEQFELLTMREYNEEDSEEDYGDRSGPDEQALVTGFDTELSDFLINNSASSMKYQTPTDLEVNQIDKTVIWLAREDNHQSKANIGSDFTLGNDSSDKHFLKLQKEFLQRNYESEEDKEVVMLQDDSDSSERKWDCETVISTLSNLDNHPAKISAPFSNRNSKIHFSVHDQASADISVIRLRGRNQLPVDFLPGRIGLKERLDKDDVGNLGSNDKKIPGNANLQPVRMHAGETRDEKKARKETVKEEKRNARRAKKELKLLYRGESRRAQHAASFTGPSVIPLK